MNLGKKKKRTELLEENADKESITKKNLQKYSMEITKKIQDIINKINNNIKTTHNIPSSLKTNIPEVKANQEIVYADGKYVGQVVNGLKEGKGIMYFNDGHYYEGDWKNDKEEGKGIEYYEEYERYEGEFKNNNK